MKTLLGPRPIQLSILLVLCGLSAACQPGDGGDPQSGTQGTDGAVAAAMGFQVSEAASAADQIGSASLAQEIQTLSSDEFGGRGPSSAGEERSVDYLTREFQALDVEPGNNGSWTQDVPLVAITTPGGPLTISGSGKSVVAGWRDGWVGWTKRAVEAAALDSSEIVFVGYGIVAQEYGWNDYEGLDVAGKTVLIMVNDPGYATGSEDTFRGNSMTYYGRWTYKFEEAARQGARGALIIHGTGAAGYPWEVVSGSWTGPQFDLVRADDNMSRAEVEGWISQDIAAELFELANVDGDALMASASQAGFTPVPLGVTAATRLTNVVERSQSKNVIARIPGSVRPDEVVVYMAHWDHFGKTTDDVPDPIFNGAFDNATGTAGLLEIARAFKSLPRAPERSVVFLGVTAEEQGLLGSAHYASNPVYPTSNTVAAINMDGLNVDGPMRDVTVVGFGASQLDDILDRHASAVGRRLRPDPEPEKGFYYRSDHFSFAKVGVPALYADAGIDHVEHGEEWTLAKRADYTANRYHKPSDEYDPNWDLSGAVEDLRLLFMVGLDVADSGAWPTWRSGNEFEAIRETDRAGGG